MGKGLNKGLNKKTKRNVLVVHKNTWVAYHECAQKETYT